MPKPSAFPVTASDQWNVKMNDVLLVPEQDTSKHYVLPLPPYSRSQIILFSFTQTRLMSALHLCSCFHSFCVFLCDCKAVWQRDRYFICTLSDAIALCNLLLSNRTSLIITWEIKQLDIYICSWPKAIKEPNSQTVCIYRYLYTHTHERMYRCTLKDGSFQYTKVVSHESIAI